MVSRKSADEGLFIIIIIFASSEPHCNIFYIFMLKIDVFVIICMICSAHSYITSFFCWWRDWVRSWWLLLEFYSHISHRAHGARYQVALWYDALSSFFFWCFMLWLWTEWCLMDSCLHKSNFIGWKANWKQKLSVNKCSRWLIFKYLTFKHFTFFKFDYLLSFFAIAHA